MSGTGPGKTGNREETVDHPVITGQQIGLLGGPLYTTYKVLGAISYASTIGSTPVYWLETNDADFNEICAINFLDKDNTLQTLTWDIDSKGFSCGFIEVDDKLISLLDTFFTSIKQTQHTGILRTIVAESYKKGMNLGAASQALAEKLFGWSPIRLFDPSQQNFLLSIRPILEKEAEITRPGEQCNFFCIENKQRLAVFKEHDGFYFRDGRKIDLTQFTLTPNVKTRNVCQDAFFNTHTYVAGPGEIKYIAELDPVYERHHVTKAEVKKRMSVNLIEPKTSRLLKQCSLTIDQVTSLPGDMLVKEIVARETGTDFSKLKSSVLEETETYLRNLGELGIITTGLRKYLHNEIKSIIGTQRSTEKTKVQALLEKTKELSDRLLPFGKSQERVFNIFYYMNLYGGLDFIHWLYNHYDFNRKTMEIEYG